MASSEALHTTTLAAAQTIDARRFLRVPEAAKWLIPVLVMAVTAGYYLKYGMLAAGPAGFMFFAITLLVEAFLMGIILDGQAEEDRQNLIRRAEQSLVR